MRLAVISDIHVMGPGEHELDQDYVKALGSGVGPVRRSWRCLLFRARRRLWNWHPESRHACFLKALEEIQAWHPDWVIANGDYGGDAGGVGISDDHTYESVAGAVTLMREVFPDRCHFLFGDHEIGKYSTNLRQGGIRLASLVRGEEELGLRSFWREQIEDKHLIGINSSLFTLDAFLPEALVDEVPAWEARRAAHAREVAEAFASVQPDERIILFCHDPGALSFLMHIPEVHQALSLVELTVLGHLHEPRLLKLAQRLPALPGWKPRYPVARIMTDGIRNAKLWAAFNPVVCPSTFGAGHHVSGGVLFLERGVDGRVFVRKHRIKLDR